MMKTPYKAVQDFEKKFKKKPCLDCVVDVDELKQEAVKWVKEDFTALGNTGGFLKSEHIINKWMKRLNITEDDLK